MSCPQCGRAALVEALADVAAQVGAVTVEVRGRARIRCDTGHETIVPTRDAAVAAIEDQLLIATAPGMLRRGARCGDCGASLVLPSRMTDTPVPFETAGQVVTVVVDAPMVRCPDCGREQLPADTAAQVRQVLNRGEVSG